MYNLHIVHQYLYLIYINRICASEVINKIFPIVLGHGATATATCFSLTSFLFLFIILFLYIYVPVFNFVVLLLSLQMITALIEFNGIN